MWSHWRAAVAGGAAVAAVTVTAVCLAATAVPAAPASTVARVRAVAPAAAAPQVPAGPVVALGDSYTAGDLLPLDLPGQPLGCLRSGKGYAVQVAKALGAGNDFVEAACTGAGVKEMTRAQRTYLGTNAPQLSVLSPDDRLVMLTLGGDDLGFLAVLRTCMALSVTNPFGSPCRSHYASGGTDQLAARIDAEQAKLTTVLHAISSRAPRARVLLVGYPDMIPQRGGCWPAVPITSGDIRYLRGIETRLNGILAASAAAAGVSYVDTYTPTIGHDFCQDHDVKYVEGLIPTSLAAPFHPNARGQNAMAAAVLATLRGVKPAG